MATKTLSVSLEAYERLANARISEKESFSRVICRAEWPAPAGTSRALLKFVEENQPGRGAEVEALDQDQTTDSPPVDHWDEN